MTKQNIEINAVSTTDNNKAQNIHEPSINDITDQQQTIELPNMLMILLKNHL